VLEAINNPSSSLEESSGSIDVVSSKFRLITTLAVSIAISVAAGTGIGIGWRNDQLAFLGVVGFGLFLAQQIASKRLLSCLWHSLATGYIAYTVANPWMKWTIEGLVDNEWGLALLVVQAVHLLHAGMYVSFAALWWMSRRWLPGGLFAAPAIWLILESVYPAMFPMRHACLIVNAEPLIQISSIFRSQTVCPCFLRGGGTEFGQFSVG